MWYSGSANIAAAEGGANRLTHCDDRLFASGRGIFADVELDAVRDGEAVPAQRDIAVVGYGLIRSGAECRSEGKGDSALERVASHIAHLSLDGVEALSFALPDLDGQQLKEMTISVYSAGTGSFGSIEQSARYVKANSSRTGRGAGRSVCWSNSGCVY